MKNLYQKITSFIQRGRDYFSEHSHAVISENLLMLRTSAYFFAIFLVVYGGITYFMMPNRMLTWIYVLFLAIDLGFWAFVRLYLRKIDPPFRVVQFTCILFMLNILAYTISVSIFPFQDRPGIFYSMGYILAAVIFVFPYHLTSIILTATTVIYLALVMHFKTPTAASYDFFSAITAWLLGYFLLYLLTDLRLRNGEALADLTQLSMTDSLTGLLNRRGAKEPMETNFRRCQRYHLPIVAIMVDVDHFKEYNDTLGHQAGDACLASLGELFSSHAYNDGILASRYGGEEFLFLLPDCGLEEGTFSALSLLEHIDLCEIPAPSGVVTASLGVAVISPGKEDTLDQLVKQADLALYYSKTHGRNCATVVDLSKGDATDSENFITLTRSQN